MGRGIRLQLTVEMFFAKR